MRNKTTALLFCFFLGGIGGHKFYLGQTGMGLAYLIFFWTGIPALIALVEFVLLLLMSEDEFNRRYNFTAMMQGATQTNQVAQNVVVNIPSQPHMTAPQPAHTSGQIDVPAKLAQLNDLRVAGALSEAEFAAEKAKLLGTNAPVAAQLPG